MQSKIKTLKGQVEYCLRNFPDTRNSDRLLAKVLWREFYPELILVFMGDQHIKLDSLFLLPSEDGIKRVRAHFQNTKKLYPPTNEDVAKERGWREDDWRSALGYGLPTEG